jgi:hypothetical protein
MVESRAVETLQNKRDDIARSIDECEAKLAQARADLAHIDAAISIFATGDDPAEETRFQGNQGKHCEQASAGDAPCSFFSRIACCDWMRQRAISRCLVQLEPNSECLFRYI